MRLLDRPPFTAVGLVWPGRALVQAPGPPLTGNEAAFRVVTANALKLNRHPRAWAARALALEPDVLCVQELTPAIDAALSSAGRGAVLPCGSADAREGSAGSGVWTRLPVESASLGEAGYVLAAIRVGLGPGSVTIASIHAVAPSSGPKERQWRRALEAIAAFVDGVPGPVVVAGDWNATLAHGPLRALLGAGRLRDAHVDAGRRFARTYSARFPMALLDRVLVSPEVGVLGIAERRLPGSDHRAVIADLALAGTTATTTATTATTAPTS